MSIRNQNKTARTTRWTRAGTLLAAVSLLLPATMHAVLPTTTASAAPQASQAQPTRDLAQSSFDAKSWDKSMEQKKKELTPEWWKRLQDAEPSKWIDQYCSAKVFQSTKLCLVVDTAKALKQGVPPSALQGNAAALRESAPSPSDSGPGTGADRIPDFGGMPPTQPKPGVNASSANHIEEYEVPGVSFPIDNKIAPDGSDWFSMLTNNGLPGVGRIDRTTHQISMFPLPVETGVTYAVNGGPGPYEWWTTIPFEGFGNKIGRINIYTHEVENWEIPTPYSYPADLKTGPDGAIWFTETRGNKIGRFDPNTKQFEEYDVDTHALTPGPASNGPTSLPQDVAVISDTSGVAPDYDCMTPTSWDPNVPRWHDVYDGGACNATGVWWVNQSPLANSLQRIDPVTREITTYPLLTPSALVLDISPGKDGRTVWFWYMGARKAGWFDPATKKMTEFGTPSPNFVCCGGAGPDKAMYWSESHFNTIGRYDLVTGQVTEIPVPTARAYTIDWQIVNGSVMFAEFRGNRMGQVVLDPRSETTSWPCGCPAPPGHSWNINPHAAAGYSGTW